MVITGVVLFDFDKDGGGDGGEEGEDDGEDDGEEDGKEVDVGEGSTSIC